MYTVMVMGWVLIIFLFIISLAGVIIPLIPDIIPLWIGIIIYSIIGSQSLPLIYWVILITVTVVIFTSDYLTNAYFVKKYGGNKWSVLGSITGILAGIVILGPLGLVVGPFIFVLIIEIMKGKRFEAALKVSTGTVIAFFSSIFIKFSLHVFLIIWFIIIII
ncbi:DUF456 domain-containing protein [Halothermothrix orenii]|uniref:Uncharacterized protein conserved in bacteria n=1 Tax=Halothermothrix orenii (strain H 168 / OCM 544 / DSM 9562) TaxID=373903 RepID=B8CX60_HALOH|nr:DUF456 domain-containing protein [Halothermothrix orenii]ACL69879.1 uncharacterized protein conserved in bacteria [Halothermothrix orenii H 168]